jgi:hypothetical protein
MRDLPADRVVALAAAALVAMAPSAARADEPDPTVAASRAYFAGERAQGVAWGATGVASLAIGAYAYSTDDDIARGLSYPFLAVGAIQLGAAVFSYISPPRRLRSYERAFAANPDEARTKERKRMKRVVVAFDALRVAYISLMVVGSGLVIAGSETERDTLVGVGGGLAFQSLAMLALDAAAEDRALRYLDSLSVTVTPTSAGLSIRW